MAEIEDDAAASIRESESVSGDINQDGRRGATNRTLRERVIVIADDKLAPAAAAAATACRTLAVAIRVTAIRALNPLIITDAAIASVVTLAGCAAAVLREAMIIRRSGSTGADAEPSIGVAERQRAAIAIGVVGPRVGVARRRR